MLDDLFPHNEDNNMSEEYQGWTNWDTWNANLWLNNDESSYREARRICIRENARDLRALAEAIIPKDEGIDFDEVNWDEIIAGFNEE